MSPLTKTKPRQMKKISYWLLHFSLKYLTREDLCSLAASLLNFCCYTVVRMIVDLTTILPAAQGCGTKQQVPSSEGSCAAVHIPAVKSSFTKDDVEILSWRVRMNRTSHRKIWSYQSI